MRILIVLAVVVLLLAVVGWITFSNEPGRSSINIETEKIREDTGEIMRSGSELLRDADEDVSPDSERVPRNASTQSK